MVPAEHGTFQLPGPQLDLGNSDAGPPKKFLHTPTYHHASNKFDVAMQSTKTIQEMLNELTKYMVCMIQLLDDYTFCRQFMSALCETLHNEVLKKGYNAKSSLIEQLFKTAHRIKEAL